jgi:hypothetical protein
MGVKKIEETQPKREWVSPKTLNQIYDVKLGTIYDWKHRPESYTFPPEMLNKSGRTLSINIAIFENWWFKRNPKK